MSGKHKNIGLYMSISYLGLWIAASILSLLFNEDVQGNTDLVNIPPFHFRSQLLGTNHLGQNQFELIFKGAKYTLLISFFSAILAVSIGIIIGGMAGYFGDNRIRIKYHQLVSLISSASFFIYFFSLSLEINEWKFSLISFSLGILLSLTSWFTLNTILRKVKYLHQNVNIPFDILNTKLTEVFFAIPSYFIILTFSPFLGDSVATIIILLGITAWPQSAFLIRAEMLKVREMNYIDALKISGLSQLRILFYHAIPNAIRPVLVNFVFLLSGLLIIESTLSFIGIGFSSDILTWGKVIGSFKHNSANWWLAFFPGIVISLTILSFHRTGKYIEAKYSI